MTPNVTWKFTADGPMGSRTNTTLAAPVDTPPKQVLDELLAAGYKNLEFTGFEWERWAWPGGYPIYYICKDGGVLCSMCANAEIKLTASTEAADDWRIVAADINYEDNSLYCGHCSGLVEAAYGDAA